MLWFEFLLTESLKNEFQFFILLSLSSATVACSTFCCSYFTTQKKEEINSHRSELFRYTDERERDAGDMKNKK